jgi:nitrate/TMAO reductase-like tetraheme cytochrome c subunit
LTSVRARVRAFLRRRLGKVVVVLLVLLALVVVLVTVAATYTERSSFCGYSCHEMNPYGDTWKASAHKDVACVRCHIKPGTVEFVEAKLSAVREVWVHFLGQVKQPIAVTEHIPDSTCTASGCHPVATIKEPASLRGVTFSHHDHRADLMCIDCHQQVVHSSTPGRPFVDPATMAFCLRCHDGASASQSCQTCHKPPHGPRGRCTDCHSLGSWTSTFVHPVALGSPHRTLVCERCHTGSTNSSLGFPNGCVSCHGNHHHDQNTLCAKCHLPTRFVPSTFKHPGAGCAGCHKRPHADRGPCLRCHTVHSWASHFTHPVALGGVHAGFACERCHTSGLSKPGRSCSSCHGSQHGGLTQCQQCHTTFGWLPSTFRHGPAGEHGAGSFACSACHPGGNFTTSYCSCHGGSPPSGG